MFAQYKRNDRYSFTIATGQGVNVIIIIFFFSANCTGTLRFHDYHARRSCCRVVISIQYWQNRHSKSRARKYFARDNLKVHKVPLMYVFICYREN